MTLIKLTKAQIREAIRLSCSKAGSTITKKKSQAARENGKLGGRPRKNK